MSRVLFKGQVASAMVIVAVIVAASQWPVGDVNIGATRHHHALVSGRRTAHSGDGVDGQANYRIREFTMKHMKHMKENQLVSSCPS